MHGIASSRVWHGLSARALAIAGMPVRVLRCQPASPWYPILFYSPIAIAAVLWNLLTGVTASWAYAVLPLGGAFLWTVIEYFIHSIGFHWPTRSPGWLAVQASHGSHHDEPTDPLRIVAHLTTSLPVALFVFAVLSLVFWDARPAALVMVGVMAGYLAYEVVHYRIHLGRKSRWLPRALVRHHLYHHHKDQTRCYGVTTPLWDRVFRTDRLPRRRRCEPASSTSEDSNHSI
ncbi:MAG TPA: sterol desaturase family protein [Gemmataceae bacterium]|nr:sterol desaturase family protein [Gemmataceae bacterium]